MKLKSFMAFLCLVACAACGSANQATTYPDDIPTQSPPVISRVDPAAAAAGEAITIYGIGFSLVPEYDIAIFGGSSSTTAATYDLVNPPVGGEVELLTVTVPADAPVGDTSILLFVDGNTSNEIAFTVNP